jgi:hypothetical protein
MREKYLMVINLKPQKGDLLKITSTNFGETETIEGRFVRFITGYTVLKINKDYKKVNVCKIDKAEIINRKNKFNV